MRLAKLLYETAVSRPRTVIAVATLITLAAAPGVLRLHLRTDGHALVPEHAPEVQHDAEIRQRFGLDDPLVVLIRSNHPAGIFNHDTLSLVVRLTEAFTALEGVRPWSIFSLATEHNDRVWPGTLRFRRFLEPFPETQEEIERLRDDLRTIKLYSGTLVSRDETATAVMVGVPPGVLRTDFYGRVRAVCDGLRPFPERIDVIGAPVAEALLGTHIMEDLGVPRIVLGHGFHTDDEPSTDVVPGSLYEFRRWIARSLGLLPIAIAIMALTFLLFFRSVAAAALPMIEVLAALIFVFGMMGWCGVPVYLTIAVLPIILVVTGVTDEIHIFTRYLHLLRGRGFPRIESSAAEPDVHPVVVRDALDELRPAIVKTSLTTAVGCLSFSLSPLAAVQAFGVFTAVGVLFCLLWSLTVIPACLVLMHPSRLMPRRRRLDASTESPLANLFARGVGTIVRARYVTVLIALAAILLAPYGLRRIQIQDSWIDGFAPESAFRRSTEYFNSQFLGTHLLHAVVTADVDAPIAGSVSANLMQAHSITLPDDIIAAPDRLVGRWIKITRVDANPESESASDSEVESDADRESDRPGVHQRGERIRRVGVEWSAPIEAATRTADGVVIRGAARHGSARAALRLYGTDEARFEIYSRPMTSPEVLRRLERFERFLAGRTSDAVGGVLGPSAYIKTTNFMSRARNEHERSIPEQADRIEWLWDQYQRIRGLEHRRQIVSDDYTTTIVTIYLNAANFIDTARLLEAVRAYARQEWEPHGLTLSFAGDVAVSQTLIDAIVRTQVRSLLGAIVGIVLITSLLGRSLRWGLLSALPCALAVLMNFAFMGFVGMPLGVATSMFTGMTLGMGIDYAVHFIERFRFARSRGASTSHAIADAASVTGPAVMVDAAAVALGFGVLTLSQVPANARFGALVILSLLTCLLASFLLLPALLSLRARIVR